MRLEPLYRLTFTYPEEWAVEIVGEGGVDEQYFFLAEGRAEGTISGRFRGANHPRRRTDRTFVPDFQGVIETDDGAILFVELRGYGRAYPPGRRQIVCSVTHVSDAEAYRRLNDVLCVGTGEVRAREDPTVLVVDIAELVWEPIAD
jgi:hypothetical protein